VCNKSNAISFSCKIAEVKIYQMERFTSRWVVPLGEGGGDFKGKLSLISFSL